MLFGQYQEQQQLPTHQVLAQALLKALVLAHHLALAPLVPEANQPRPALVLVHLAHSHLALLPQEAPVVQNHLAQARPEVLALQPQAQGVLAPLLALAEVPVPQAQHQAQLVPALVLAEAVAEAPQPQLVLVPQALEVKVHPAHLVLAPAHQKAFHLPLALAEANRLAPQVQEVQVPAIALAPQFRLVLAPAHQAQFHSHNLIYANN